MSILDTFYILFKSNADEVIKGNKAVEKSTKDTERSLKNTTDQTKDLGISFVKMVEAAATAAGAIGGFQLFKNAIDQTNDYNVSLDNLGKKFGTTGEAIKRFAQASAESGGSIQDAISDFLSINAIAQKAGRTIGNPEDFLAGMRDKVRDKNGKLLPPGARNSILEANGITGSGDINRILMNEDDFKESQKSAAADAILSPEDAIKAAQVRSAKMKRRGAEGNLETKGNTGTSDESNFILDTWKNVTNWFAENPTKAVSGIGATILGGALWKGQLLKTAAKSIFNAFGKTATTQSSFEEGLANFAPRAAAVAEGVSLWPIALAGSPLALETIFQKQIEAWLVKKLLEDQQPRKPVSETFKKEGMNIGPVLPFKAPSSDISNVSNYPDDKDISNDPAAMNDIKRALSTSNHIQNAKNRLAIASQLSPVNSGTTIIKIDKIDVVTQATDAPGIAKGIAGELEDKFRTMLGFLQVVNDDGTSK